VQRAGLGPPIVNQLSEALSAAAALVDDLSPQSLTWATPCPGWSVLELVNHLAGVTEKFERFAAGTRGLIRQSPDGLVGTQPARNFRAGVEAAVTTWRRHPEALEAACVLPFGSFDGATAAGLNLFDAVVHGWDIAIGAGVDHQMDDALAAVALRIADLRVTDQARRSWHYAAPILTPNLTPIVTPVGAPFSIRLLAATGRCSPPPAPAP